MDLFNSIFLGIIQGLTEFLPISSSGHLVIFQHILGIKEPEIFFDICLHAGTLCAILIFYFKRIINLTASCFDFNGIKTKSNKDFVIVLMIITGSIPTAAIGLLIKKFSDQIFANIFLTGFMLLITASFLFASKFFNEKPQKDLSLYDSLKNALIIGTVQGFAVFPGISRSGSTIVTGLFLGLNKKFAAEFSFLLSVPAIAGAQILSLGDVSKEYISKNLFYVLSGTFISFLTGYFALVVLIKILNKGKFYYFAPYCLLASGICFILNFLQ
ncbi:MAG: undecaprenyl-diphosphatase UppP [Desulforegulaceae bacterium]|jgi:undecaprenyl-diphosphatase|nr:undecaprenyl-diphosphatase UppP [Desulforegulaceae bacterium]